MPLDELDLSLVSDERERIAAKVIFDELARDTRIRRGFVLPGFRVPGSDTKDCDLILCLNFTDPIALTRTGSEIVAENLLLLLEIKSHPKFEVQKSRILVEYKNQHGTKLKDALQQVTRVSQNLKQYFEAYARQFKYSRAPWVYGFVFFYRIPQASVPTAHPLIEENVIFRDTITLDDLLAKCAAQRSLPTHRQRSRARVSSWLAENETISSDEIVNRFAEALGYFKKPISVTEYDRRRLELFTRDAVEKPLSRLQLLGTELILLKGKAGTGKTMHLLHLAQSLAQDGVNTALVTYNLALVSDLGRLIEILKQEDLMEIGSTAVFSISQVVYQVCKELMGSIQFEKISEQLESDYLTGYDAMLAFIQGEVLSKLDVREWLTDALDDRLLRADFILVDEGQDWHIAEIELLKNIVQSWNRLIVATGPDQKTRKFESYWQEMAPKSMPIYCQQNLRQFFLPFIFNQKLSKLLSEKWTENTLSEENSGALKLISDDDLEKGLFWEQLGQQLNQSGNKPIDALIVNPSNLVKNKKLSTIFEKNGLHLWDGTKQSVRRSIFPVSADEYRSVYYESARGLEGWVCIVRCFDLQYKVLLDRNRGILSKEQIDALFLRTLRIATTRGVHSIILTYHNPDHHTVGLVKPIVELAREYAS